MRSTHPNGNEHRKLDKKSVSPRKQTFPTIPQIKVSTDNKKQSSMNIQQQPSDEDLVSSTFTFGQHKPSNFDKNFIKATANPPTQKSAPPKTVSGLAALRSSSSHPNLVFQSKITPIKNNWGDSNGKLVQINTPSTATTTRTSSDLKSTKSLNNQKESLLQQELQRHYSNKQTLLVK